MNQINDTKHNYEEKLELFIDEAISKAQENLISIRKELDLSQQSAADNANLSKPTIINLEKHNQFTILRSLIKLSIAYNKPFSELLNLDEMIENFIKNEGMM